MDTETPEVSIIIPCRNERQHIKACLDSVLCQQAPTGGLEVLIADGMSDDGTREFIREYAEGNESLRLVDNPRQITSTGLNAAIRAARGKIIVRMDAHTEYALDYVRQCVAVMKSKQVDNVGGAARTKGDGYLQSAIGAAFHSPFSTGGAGFHQADYEGEVDTVVYGCWYRQKLLEVGLFDEELVRNQDDELNFRIRNMGGRLWQSRSIHSWYRPRGSLKSLFRQYLQYGYWKVRVIQKHRRPASVRQLIPVIFVLGVLLGWIVGQVHPTLKVTYWATLATYGITSLAFSIRTLTFAQWRLLPIMPVVFFVYHLSYGLGFTWGILDFLLLHRSGRSMMSGLSRS
ncbi:MAG: glycosyltransferase family 2 protein [Pirellulales bacterium]